MAGLEQGLICTYPAGVTWGRKILTPPTRFQSSKLLKLLFPKSGQRWLRSYFLLTWHCTLLRQKGDVLEHSFKQEGYWTTEKIQLFLPICHPLTISPYSHISLPPMLSRILFSSQKCLYLCYYSTTLCYPAPDTLTQSSPSKDCWSQ